VQLFIHINLKKKKKGRHLLFFFTCSGEAANPAPPRSACTSLNGFQWPLPIEIGGEEATSCGGADDDFDAIDEAIVASKGTRDGDGGGLDASNVSSALMACEGVRIAPSMYGDRRCGRSKKS